jgi:hypothetical protein|tara:strand:- start:492 stop:761 length:270 start_codon:yes stop_codon:yes gene_type:complete
MPKDACYRKVKAKFKVFPSAYASGHIAKCRKVGAANYGKAKKKAEGGVIELKKGGKVPKRTRKRKTKNPNIARGCGAVMSNRRKVTKFR